MKKKKTEPKPNLPVDHPHSPIKKILHEPTKLNINDLAVLGKHGHNRHHLHKLVDDTETISMFSATSKKE